MKIDPTIIMMGCDIGVRGGPFGNTLDLMNLYGKDRVIDTPDQRTCVCRRRRGSCGNGSAPGDRGAVFRLDYARDGSV